MNRLYVADGAGFRFATAEEIRATAHRVIDQPTVVDREVHHTLVRALDLIDVPVLDHLIVGENVFSFRQARQL